MLTNNARESRHLTVRDVDKNAVFFKLGGGTILIAVPKGASISTDDIFMP